jgi:ubiquinone/menaquinone biosynthesis C-methylase UbiE
VAGEYTIAGGAAEADRLARQADVMGEATFAFLERSGLRRGAACLDLGCGEGQVSIAMARVVGTGGRVVGIDVDPQALHDAAVAAERAKVQATFLRADASEPVAEPLFDLAYCRLLLSHLVDPVAVIRVMRDAVRPGGVVAVEDLLTGTLRSEPPRPVLDELQSVYAATVRAHGGDPTIGPRLGAMLRACGLVNVNETVVANPMTSVAQKCFLVELVQNMRTSILETGSATSDEIASIERRTRDAAYDSSTIFYQAQMYQVCGRRSAV